MVAPNHLYKSGHSEKAVPQIIYKLFFVHLSKALAAINRTVLTGTEGNLRLFAAVGANGGEHLTVGSLVLLAGVAAGLAALGLIGKTALGIELLLTGGEHELIATFFAY